MFSPQSMNHILRLRVGDPMLDLVADVLTDICSANSAEMVGQLTVKAEPGAMNPGVEPHDKPGLTYDLPAVVRIVNEHAFQPPGSEGPSGGCAMRIIGPVHITPNRPGDVALDIPDGTIVCDRLILGGTEVILEDC